MGRLLFSEDAINNMFDSDSLPCGSKVNSVLGKKSCNRNTRLADVRVFDPFEIMDQAEDAGDLGLFDCFFEDEVTSVETLPNFKAGEKNELDDSYSIHSNLDEIEVFFENPKLQKRFSDRRLLKKPIFILPSQLRLV